MSKVTKRKITVESAHNNNNNSNNKDQRQGRPSVFERLGTKTSAPLSVNTTTSSPLGESFCRHWAQNGNCPYGKTCKYANTHILISPSKRGSKKESESKQVVSRSVEECKRLHSTVVKRGGGGSPEVNWDNWDQTVLEYEDEKVLEKRLKLLQQELELQMKHDETEHQHGNANHSKIHKKVTVNKSKKGGGSSSSRSCSSSTDSSDDSSTSSAWSGQNASRPAATKVKRRRSSSASDTPKTKPTKAESTSSPSVNKARSSAEKKKRDNSSPVKQSQSSSKSRSITHKKSHSPTPRSSHRSRHTDSPPKNKKTSITSSTSRHVSPRGSSSRKRSVSKDKHKTKPRTPPPPLIRRLLPPRRPSPPSKRQSSSSSRLPQRNRNDDKKKDEDRNKSGGRSKEEPRRKSGQSSSDNRDKRDHGDDLTRSRVRDSRDTTREKERLAALERCKERQRERELAKEKEKEKERDKGKERQKESKKEFDREIPSLLSLTTHNPAERGRDRERDRDRSITERDKATDRTTERSRYTDKDRGEKSGADRDKERGRERERGGERDFVERGRRGGSGGGSVGSRAGKAVESRVRDKEVERSTSLDKDRSRARERKSPERERVVDKDRERRERDRFEAGRERVFEPLRGGPQHEEVVTYRDRERERGHYAADPERVLYKEVPSPARDREPNRLQSGFSEERRGRRSGGWSGVYDEVGTGVKPRDWEFSGNRRDWESRQRRGHEDWADGGEGEQWRYSEWAGPGLDWRGEEWGTGARHNPQPSHVVPSNHIVITDATLDDLNARRNPHPQQVDKDLGASGIQDTESGELKRTGEENVVTNLDAKKPRLDIVEPLEEELSDISDEADEILNREDSVEKSPYTEENTELSHIIQSKTEATCESSIPRDETSLGDGVSPAHILQETSEHRLSDGADEERIDDLDFEEISDEELEEEARANKGVGDALGVDWASLVVESRAQRESEAVEGSANKRWEPDRLLAHIGVSLQYSGGKIGAEDVFVAGIKVGLKRKAARRKALFSGADLFKRALSARQDIAIRRQLCSLPVASLGTQQVAGFCQWVV